MSIASRSLPKRKFNSSKTINMITSKISDLAPQYRIANLVEESEDPAEKKLREEFRKKELDLLLKTQSQQQIANHSDYYGNDRAEKSKGYNREAKKFNPETLPAQFVSTKATVLSSSVVNPTYSESTQFTTQSKITGVHQSNKANQNTHIQIHSKQQKQKNDETDDNLKKNITKFIPGINLDMMQPAKGVTIKMNGVTKHGGNFTNLSSNVSQTMKPSTSINQMMQSINEGGGVVVDMNIEKERKSLPPISKNKTFTGGASLQSNNIINDIRYSYGNVKSETMKINHGKLSSIFDDNNDSENFHDTRNKDYMYSGDTHDYYANNYKNHHNDFEYTDQLNDINAFNAGLMNNPNWGNENNHSSHNGAYYKSNFHSSNNLARVPIKPDRKRIEKEVGINIMNTKMPRSRKFAFSKSKTIK